MTSVSWHARITCGRATGAGFLVTERHVLTCAHVVASSPADEVSVSFVHSGEEAIPARVIAHGGWDSSDTARGDLAVLELDREVALKPAEFAAPSDAHGHPPRKLLAYGFPKRYEEGAIVEYRATADQLIAGEWVQLEAWTAHGQPLAPGFSGAAVTLADSGRVVGMVSAAARDPANRNGRMLPAQVMARYWPRLGDLIPTPEYDRAQKETLRRLVEAVARHGEPECGPERLYRDAVGNVGAYPPPHGFNSLWDAAWHLLSEEYDPKAVVRFAARLADFSRDAPTRSALRSWPYARRKPAPVPRPVHVHAWSPILVEIAPSGSGIDQFLVEVSAYNGTHRRVVGSRRLSADRVRPYALDRIDDAYNELELGKRELIVFVLPRRWLNSDVAQWRFGADDDSPLGSLAPLVVMDLERRRSGSLQHKLAQKWQHLDGRPTAQLLRIGCTDQRGQDPAKLAVDLHHSADMVGFGAPPRSHHNKMLFHASLNAAVPVMLWPRTDCQGGPSHEGCRGSAFLDRLADHVAGLPPGELPSYVHELRKTAFASDGLEPHWAYDLALLWEDPRYLPEPVGYRHSPVA
ncbi:trypsin-like peptidase domain-containing protein [Streptomyces sp. NBC_00878]|uniref:VMAP-C domain-containing protein n=1 Tax=Streptomyces sp. NBC_00878 TaxID=2975854 RepID=UPI00225A23E6|nr:trypsin-like peptidase domain-containing protein [Streptomyces sp. NBC_00878]MCX4908993.1 serine protease [Streptomyces sp. NBC_00878]